MIFHSKKKLSRLDPMTMDSPKCILQCSWKMVVSWVIGVPRFLSSISRWDFPVHKNHPSIGNFPMTFAGNPQIFIKLFHDFDDSRFHGSAEWFHEITAEALRPKDLPRIASAEDTWAQACGCCFEHPDTTTRREVKKNHHGRSIVSKGCIYFITY